MSDLDKSAWERWVTFRKAIRKPIKPASEQAMKLKLARYGADQAAVVDQSISNQWQGLFDLKDKKKPDKPTRTPEQQAAADAQFQQSQERAIKGWDKQEPTPLVKLKLADALLARYSVSQDEPGHGERMEWLRGRVAELLRDAVATEVYGDPALRSMVLMFWGEKGVFRLQARAETERVQGQPNVVDHLAHAVHQ